MTKEETLKAFETVYDIVYFLEMCDYESRDSFCNMVLGTQCDRCRWKELCEDIPDGNPFDPLFAEYAEYLI